MRIALTPRSGWEPCAAFPCATAVTQAPPRSARAISISDGSPTIAASWSSRPCSRRTLRAVDPGVLLVGDQMQVERSREREAGAADRRDGRRARTAIGPFMSHAPRPTSLPSTTAPSNGPLDQVDGSPAGTVSRCPFQARRGAPRSRSSPRRSDVRSSDRTTRMSAPRSGEDADRDVGDLVLGAARVLRRRRDQRPCVAEHLVGVGGIGRRSRRPCRRPTDAGSATSSPTMAADATRALTAGSACAPRWTRRRRTRRRRATASPPSSRRSSSRRSRR